MGTSTSLPASHCKTRVSEALLVESDAFVDRFSSLKPCPPPLLRTPGESLRSKHGLSAAQESRFKRQRRKGAAASRAEGSPSTVLTEHDERCFEDTRNRGETRLANKFNRRRLHLTECEKELQIRVEADIEHLKRQRQAMSGDITELLVYVRWHRRRHRSPNYLRVG